jgi:carbonic anhydrase
MSPGTTRRSTLAASASSSSVWCACAVSRSRDRPSGVDGGRKQPIRSPCPAAAATPSSASRGPGIGTDSTAPAGGPTPAASARTWPALRVAVVACMDARLDPRGLLGLHDGDAHVIRNAGGVVTPDVIRSLTISQRLLGTTEIVLVHHTRCGMMSFTDAEFRARLRADTGTEPDWDPGAFASLEQSVRDSAAQIAASPFIMHKDAIRGFVFAVESGTLAGISLTSLNSDRHIQGRPISGPAK